MRSPAGLGSPARLARKRAAATAGEALAAGAPMVVELGEVGGEGCIFEPTSVEPGVEAPERAGSGAAAPVTRPRRADGAAVA